MHYISELRDGSSVREIYLCKKRQSLVTRAGKNYESLTFQDKTGTIDAKIWDPDSMGIGEFGEMDYAEVSGEVITFQGHLQLNVRRARLCHEGEYDPANYLPVSDRNIDDMFRTILKFVDSIENPYLNRLLKMFFVDDPEFVRDFKQSSAAKSVHHGFIGGLCEHTLGVAQLCHFYCKCYPLLKRDLLVSVALLHDIGKVRELSAFPRNDYTEEGQLIGHIVIGSMKRSKRSKIFLPSWQQRSVTASSPTTVSLNSARPKNLPSSKRPPLILLTTQTPRWKSSKKLFSELLSATDGSATRASCRRM